MNLSTLHSVYFIGIGGIGMSALARYFKFMGKEVAGYDKVSTPLTQELEVLGISIHYEDSMQLVPQRFVEKDTLVVYTPAVPVDHTEYQYFQQHGFELKKRSEVLGMITKDTFCFAVAGTHGKTTTSSILAHLLKEAGTPVSAFLGGVSEDFNSNFIYEGNTFSVVEADEFDRSFLRLSPNVACVTSMDADHLDIYGDAEALKTSFLDFVERIKPGGKLFVHKGLPLEGTSYGLDADADINAHNIRVENGTYLFDVQTPKGSFSDVRFNKPGRHNLLNGLAAFAMALESGAEPARLTQALGTFKGVQRRFSYQIKTADFVYIDDYAHHPTEIDAVYSAVSEMHPGKDTMIIFQPHLFSRTRDFADDFAKSLSKFDQVVLLDIYPAREKPMVGITAHWLLEKVENEYKKVIGKDKILQEIKDRKPSVLITVGAGDIGLEVPKIKKEFEHGL